MIGFAICGSFCTHKAALQKLRELRDNYEIQPIMSDASYSTDTRFGKAADTVKTVETVCGREIIHTIEKAEPLGPAAPLESLIILPCTGNTLAKLAHGITDTPVTMAAKAHLRQGRPLVIALFTNDALSGNLENVGRLMNRKNVYFVPMAEDDPENKPYSLTADLSFTETALRYAAEGRQIMPLFVQKGTKTKTGPAG
ncbi:MAG: dipicolinate synthase subunit B [Clostridia bacterium]|nr:dipicolinate synthase subunit B [Clostridia bacterium]